MAKEVPMRPTEALFVLLALACALELPPAAKAQSWNRNNQVGTAELRSFDGFLRNHPWIAQKLREQPSRVNDKDFVNDNNELKEWLRDYPAAAQAFRADPRGFMERERSFQSSGGGSDFGNAASFDAFLQEHRWIADKLWEQPSRVNDEDFVNGNPELKQWLREHPAAAHAFHSDPKGFMERERSFQSSGSDFGDVGSFDAFLHDHPWIADKLWEQPSRVNDEDFVNGNPELKQWLREHPAAAQAFHESPKDFMDRARSFRSYGR
jgi:hypothetical protein